MRPGRVCRIRLLLISRRSSCHLSLSLVTLRRRLSLVVAGRDFFFHVCNRPFPTWPDQVVFIFFISWRLYFSVNAIKWKFLFLPLLPSCLFQTIRLISFLPLSRPLSFASAWWTTSHPAVYTKRLQGEVRLLELCWSAARRRVTRDSYPEPFVFFFPPFFFWPFNFRDGHVSADSRRSAVGRGQRPSSSEWRDGRNLDGGGGQFSRDSTCFQWRYFLVRNPSGWTTSL